jgi:hypothetical protein
MLRKLWKIMAVGTLMSLASMSLAAHAQTVGAQSLSVQSSSAQTSVGQTSVAATVKASSGQASARQASSGQTPSGQSLGDIARALREKQASSQNSSNQAASAPPKVITNQDLGEGPEGRPDLRVAPRPASFDRGSGLQPGEPRMGDARAEQWRGQILEQKSRVAALQARIDQINASLQSGAQLQYNRNQAFQAERVAQMQMHLDEQKRRLYEMQEAARRAGMHTQVVDP